MAQEHLQSVKEKKKAHTTPILYSIIIERLQHRFTGEKIVKLQWNSTTEVKLPKNYAFLTNTDIMFHL